MTSEESHSDLGGAEQFGTAVWKWNAGEEKWDLATDNSSAGNAAVAPTEPGQYDGHCVRTLSAPAAGV